MKRLLITILCLVAVISFAGVSQWMQMVVARKNAGGELTYTLVQEEATPLTTQPLGDAFGCWASQVKAAESHDVTKISVLLYAIGTITGNMTCYLYTSTDVTTDDLNPDDRVATADSTYDVSTITTDTGGEVIEFTFASPYSATSTENYSIVLCWDAGDASNLITIRDADNLTPTADFLVSRRGGDGLPNATNDSSNWTGVDGDEAFIFQTFKSP